MHHGGGHWKLPPSVGCHGLSFASRGNGRGCYRRKRALFPVLLCRSQQAPTVQQLTVNGTSSGATCLGIWRVLLGTHPSHWVDSRESQSVAPPYEYPPCPPPPSTWGDGLLGSTRLPHWVLLVGYLPWAASPGLLREGFSVSKFWHLSTIPNRKNLKHRQAHKIPVLLGQEKLSNQARWDLTTPVKTVLKHWLPKALVYKIFKNHNRIKWILLIQA